MGGEAESCPGLMGKRKGSSWCEVRVRPGGREIHEARCLLASGVQGWVCMGSPAGGRAGE